MVVDNQMDILTPQMRAYDDFDDARFRNYKPYLMYFHRTNYRSPVVNTDRLGFRVSHGAGVTGSVADECPQRSVRLVAGASIGFGLGTTCDEATIASRLWTEYAPSTPWLNLNGVRFNTAQEVLLYCLYRHLLPEVEEVVIFSGFNALDLARRPQYQQDEHGSFYLRAQYSEMMDELRARSWKRRLFGLRRRNPRAAPSEEPAPSLTETIARAADLTGRHLDCWRQLLVGTGARLTYVLHPLATWVREQHAPEEKTLFDYQDRVSKRGTWEERYGTLSAPEAGRDYSDVIRVVCEKTQVKFIDMAPLLRSEITEQDWLYIDRCHMTDQGNDIVSRIVARELQLEWSPPTSPQGSPRARCVPKWLPSGDGLAALPQVNTGHTDEQRGS